ncbi:hypothetical protein RhiirC2_735627 [Rhizophagus irregularis]|uniref:DNA-directed RNA polymerase III subunit RPC3 n=1 Tax=Rhizophagus irregularis TaxID=588596 RepID=A0A2N1NPM0_9GLOM|nr:hypothetical protein RhiirC2_735627 [Rhizophagus irregularis]
MYFKYVDAISAQRIIRNENMGGMYIIRYNEICESLKKEIFEDVIMEKYGFKGVRIVRLLYEKSKLDEKAVKARQKLTELMSGGFVQIQEVPRSADRAPSRTFYLWDIDYKKCYDVLLNNYHQTLANIHQVRFDYESGASKTPRKERKRRCITTIE